VSGHTQEESDSKVSKAWSSLFNPSGSGTIYYNGPGTDESYVQDIYNNDVRSEGMSYGMMVAVQLDHQTEFDRLWTWVRNHMAQNCSGDKCTGEIAWSCATSGSKKSTGGAPDGEEYMATALIFAHNRWGDTGKYKYATEAQWVLDIIRTKYFHTNPHIVKFGTMSNVSDPSYVLPAFYQAWACFDTTNATFWNTAVKDGRAFFHNDVDGNGVCPYQANWDGSQTAGANSDSVRCVVNIMMDYNFFKADSWQSQTYAPKFAAHEKNAGPPSSYCDALLGFGLPAADGKAFVDKIWSANVPSHDYWNGVLYMLSLLHVSGNFKLYY
jgi:oligosaccharide reducing-end xylanase